MGNLVRHACAPPLSETVGTTRSARDLEMNEFICSRSRSRSTYREHMIMPSWTTEAHETDISASLEMARLRTIDLVPQPYPRTNLFCQL
jgi:hypothetical protein